MKKLIAVSIFCLLQISTGWLTNFNEAKKQAVQKHELILLNFSGSDWCGSCIRLHKDIFETSVFKKFADSNLVLINADFPRLNKHKLSKELQNQNDSLADKYNPNGKFPYTLLMNANGKVLKDWDDGYPKQTPEEFVQAIKKFAMQTNEASIFKRVLRLMGNRFEISVVNNDEAFANECIDAAINEIQRIEKLLTTFSDDSQTNQINANAEIAPISVDKEVFDLIKRSIKISELTQGAFDITYGSIDKKLWNFDKTMTSLPDAQTAKKMVRLINYHNIILDETNHSVFLKNKGMRIGFGAIGKGYAAEQAKSILQKKGIKSGIVNAAGDLTAWGYQPNGNAWTIGIANPDAAHLPFSYLNITNTSVATSGNYEKFVIINGKKYSHTIDPKTGLPVQGIKSVTIITPNAEIADAMATPIMIMGIKVGLDLINQMKNIACIIIDEQDNLYHSKNINLVSQK